MKPIVIKDTAKLGSYDEVEGVELSTITKKTKDKEILSGLIVRGYETKFGTTNQNRERFESGCLDNFIDAYFLKNEYNMPVTLQHRDDLDHLAGRVLVLEVNSVGFYFVVYIPRTIERYEQIKNLLKEGILQGFSKEGWATDYDFVYKDDGSFDYMKVKEMSIFKVSLVASPANDSTFEKIQEIKNSFVFKKQKQEETDIDSFFN